MYPWCVAAQGNYFEGDTIDVKKIKTLVNKKSVSLLNLQTLYVHSLHSTICLLYIDVKSIYGEDAKDLIY